MDPELHQNRAPEAPKTLLEPGCRQKLVSEPFWGPFWTPRDPENRALAVARCYFLLIWRHAREPEITPQMSPKSSLKRPPEAPECPKMSLQIGARISIKFQLRFWRFWSPKMAPKIAQKTASEPRAHAQSLPRARPEASREPFGRHFGLILASIWAIRGLMFELFRGARLLLLACCSSIAGALFLLRPLLRCSPSELPGYEAQVTKAIASWFS